MPPNDGRRSDVVIEQDQWTLTITRILNAPRDLVWKAWTVDEHLKNWFCPSGFTTQFIECEVRPGGRWRSGMRPPGGGELVRCGEFREVVPPARIVFTHAWEEDHPDHPCQTTTPTIVTVTFKERGDKTEMIFEQRGFISAESRDAHEGGWNSSFDHLETFLASG